MRIGDTVLYQGQEFILRGLDPMSVENRQAELQVGVASRLRLHVSPR